MVFIMAMTYIPQQNNVSVVLDTASGVRGTSSMIASGTKFRIKTFVVAKNLTLWSGEWHNYFSQLKKYLPYEIF